MAAPGLSTAAPTLLLFALGAVIMRGAGCIINDIWDRDIDRQVARTSARPLASGELTLTQALLFLAALLGAGLVILLQFNSLTIILGVIFLLPVALYPLAKRFMALPQLFLGLTFNAGALMGWTSITGTLAPSAWLLYAACICWTLSYDTLYAHQDKQHDAKLGVKSSALTWGDSKRIIVCLLLAMGALLCAAGMQSDLTVTYYIGVTAGVVFGIWQVMRVNLDVPADCMQAFRSNTYMGWIVFIGIILSH